MDANMRPTGSKERMTWLWRLEKAASTAGEFLGRLVVLFKLRVVALLLLASLGGALLASEGSLTLGQIILLLITGTFSSAGASAINQYLERERDGHMARTRRRPLVIGAYSRPEVAVEAGVTLVILAVMIALPYDPSLAFFLAAGAVIYVGVYTLWLKPRTWLNIVIGGAAGSCAVLSGGAVAGNWSEPGVVVLALLVFVWTPTHFWSLAQAYREDYARASVPMLPVIVSPRASAWWITLHTSLVGVIGLALGAHAALGWPYLLITLPATVWLGWQSQRLIATPDRQQALAVFKVSNAYLGLVLLAIHIVTLF